MGGQLVFGHTATVHPSTTLALGGMPTRSLTLRLSQARAADVERGLCVLHERNLEALGVRPGEFVQVLRPIRADGKCQVRRITLRCSKAGTGTGPDYPSMERIYLDEQSRDELLIDRDRPHLGMPLLVRPSNWRAIQSRLVLYGITVLLGISAFTDIVGRLTGWSNRSVAVAALTLAGIVTVGLALFDLRAKMQP